MPSNVRQLLENGTPIYPITERSLVIGLQDAPFEYYVVAWDGASTPVVANIPAGVVVTYNNVNYTGTLAAGSATAPYLYLVASTTQAGEYDRYIVTNNGNNTFSWTPVGSTAPLTPVIVDNLTTNDATKALSAKQGKVLKDELSQFEAKVDVLGYGINERIQAAPGTNYPISGLVLKAGYKYRVSIRANDSGSFAITLYSNGATITGFSGTSDESIITPSQDYDNIVVYCGSATTSTDITVAIQRTPSNEELEIEVEKLGREVNGVDISQNITATSGETISATIPLSLFAGEKITVKMVGDEVSSVTVPVYANVVNSANLLGRLYINGDEAEFTLPVDITELKIYVYSSYVSASGSFSCEVTSKGIYNSRIDKLEKDVEKLSGSEGELDINVASGTTISTLISHQFNVGDTVTIKATGVTAGTLPLRVYQEAQAPENLIGTVPYDGTEQTMTITREISSLLLYLYSTYVTTSGTLHIEIKFNGEVGTTRDIAEKALAKNVLYEIRFQKENTLFIDNMFRNIVDASRPSNIYFKFDGDLYISNFRTGVARTYTLNDFKALSALEWEDGMDMLVVPQGKRVSYNLETDELYVVQYSYYAVGENELVLLDTFGTIPPGNSWTNNIRGVLVDIWYKVLGTKHEVDLRLQTPNLYWLEAINEWLNNFVSVASPDSLVFSLTSDMHDNCYLAANSNRDNCYPIVNYIHKRAFAPRFHIDLGDIIIQDSNSYDKEHWGLAGARAAMGQFDVKHKFIAIGNHDYNSAPEYVISGQGQTRANMFTDTEVYNSYARSIEQEGVVWGSRRKVYYYKDWEDFKIRMIVLNTQDNELEYGQDGVLLWDPMGKCTFRQEQYEWLINVALDFSSKGADKSNWQTLVFCHISPAPGYNGIPNSVNANGVELDDNGAVVKVDGVPVPCENGVYKALYAFKNGTLLSYSHLDNWQGGRATIAQRDSQGNPVYDGANLVPVTKDFSTQGAMTLIGVFSGHEHLYRNLDYGGIIFRTFPNGTHAYQAEIPAMGTDNVSVGLFAIDPIARTITIRYIGAHDVEYEGETITIAKDEDLTY